jgi:hypothetical protein
LRRLEGYRSFPTALRTHGHGLCFGKPRTRRSLALGLASLAALGLILEILIVEEMLLSGCENEISSAIHAFENAILKLRHMNLCPVTNLNSVGY